MATKTVAAALAVALLTTTTAYAAPQVWLDNGTWQVWQDVINDGTKMCYMKHLHPTTKGYATFGIAQSDSRNMATFMYTEDGLVWTQAGTLTIQIDNATPWRATAHTYTDDRKILSVEMGANSGRFLNEIWAGTSLRITTLNGTRVFSLVGSREAGDVAGRCVVQVAAERGTPTEPTPGWTPLPGHRSTPVQAAGPARML